MRKALTYFLTFEHPRPNSQTNTILSKLRNWLILMFEGYDIQPRVFHFPKSQPSKASSCYCGCGRGSKTQVTLFSQLKLSAGFKEKVVNLSWEIPMKF